MAKVLDFQLSHHSFQRNPRADLLQNGLVGYPCSPRGQGLTSPPSPQLLGCLFASLVLALIRGMFGSLEAGSGQRQCGGLPDPLQDFAPGS